MNAYERFDESHTVVVFSKWTILDMKFANFLPLWRHLYGHDDWWPPFFILDFQRASDNDSLCKV